MTEARTQAPSRRARILLFGAPLLLLGSWQGVLWGARQCSNRAIQGAVDQPLPAFRLADESGGEISDQQLRGRPVLLHFFRSHCEACVAESHEWLQLERVLPQQQVAIVHVMTDRVLGFDPAVTAATLAHHGFQRPVALADTAFMAAFHSVTWSQVTPVTYVVDARGRIRHALRGRQSAAGLQALLAGLD